MTLPRDNQPVEDLVDFYRSWPDLRSHAMRLQQKSSLDDAERSLLGWMIFVVDRVGPSDLDVLGEEI